MAAPYLVLDIETIVDQELPIAESSEAERLPAPPHHRVVAIGALWVSSDYTPRRLAVLAENQPEPQILAEFARVLEERKPCLVTYNGRGFDLPVIATRCLRYGISLSHYYRSRDVRYRYSAEGHLDLMDYVADFGAAKPSRLDVIAKLCGMPGKVGLDGKHVGPLVHAGKLDQVNSYCLCDVVQTAGVFLRVQLLRGELPRPEYLTAMSALLALTKSDSRLSPVATGLNEARLLLRES